MSRLSIVSRRRLPLRTVVYMAVTASCGAAAGTVFAQEAAAPAASSPASQDDASTAKSKANLDVQAVVVTATRRREPSREVPMQVNVLSTDDLAKAGAHTLSDYMALQPGIDVKTYGGAGLGGVSIRGVSTGDQTSSTVGTYIDDVAVGSSTAFANGANNAIDMALLDLNHLEVLRGPQGTLYGAGAMGGVIKYVTNEPDTYELSGTVSLTGGFTRGGAPSNTESFIVNVPLKEQVAAVRISAFTDKQGGWVDAVGPAAARNVNGGRTSGGRISLLLEPTSRFKARLTETVQELKRSGTDYVDYDYNTGRPFDPSTGVAVSRSQRWLALREPYLLKVAVTGADLEYDMGWARLNSISSVQQTRYDTQNDFTGVYGPIAVGAGLPVQSVLLHAVSEVKKQSQEFRLTSKAGQPIEWIAGLWWTHEVGTNDQNLTTTLDDSSAGPALISGALPSTYHELAAYGDVTWNVSKSFALTAGLRVAHNRQTFAEKADGVFVAPVDEASASRETPKTYMLTAKYAIDATSNVYARAASGYRPGGPNFIVIDPETGKSSAPPSFRHDSLWSYEAGYKADLLDKSLNVEASVYDIRWHDIQQSIAFQGINAYINSGQAEIKGAELASTWRAAPSFTLSGSLAFIDARLDKPADGLGKSGARLPNSARVAGTVAANYTFDVATYASYVGITQRYSGERNAGFDGSDSLPNYRLPAYAMTDLQAGIDFKKVALAFFARNLFDRKAQLSATTQDVPVGGPVWVSESRPREIGMTLSASF